MQYRYRPFVCQTRNDSRNMVTWLPIVDSTDGTMEIESLHDMFVYELRGAYHMEHQLVDALDEMAINATEDRVSQAFANHRDETQEHVERVREAFEAMGLQPEERESPIVEALDEERRTVEESVQDEDILNLFYIGAGMKTERIELTTYDTLLTMADRLDLDDDVTDPLEANRDSEDETLTQLRTMATASELKSLWQKLMP